MAGQVPPPLQTLQQPPQQQQHQLPEDEKQQLLHSDLDLDIDPQPNPNLHHPRRSLWPHDDRPQPDEESIHFELKQKGPLPASTNGPVLSPHNCPAQHASFLTRYPARCAALLLVCLLLAILSAPRTITCHHLPARLAPSLATQAKRVPLEAHIM